MSSSLYTQQNRPMSVTTPLGADKLLLEQFAGREAISELFVFTLDLLSQSDTPVAFDQLIGQSVTVMVEMVTKKPRYFNGIVARFREGPKIRGAEANSTMIRYQADIVPQFWLLTRKQNSRIFQQVSVVDILTTVLTGVTIKNQITGTYEPRDYCVQYRETDYDFCSRLMEEEGIFYFFEHADGTHTMVLADAPTAHQPIVDPVQIIYRRPDAPPASGETQDRILSWRKSQEMRSGKYTLWDHCFELPGKNLEAKSQIAASATAGTITHKQKVGGNDAYEIYDYPGEYAQRFDGVDPGGSPQPPEVQKIFTDNVRTVGIRMQQEALPGLLIVGESKCRNFSSGSKFTLAEHFDANGDYLLTVVEHVAALEGVYSAESGGARLRYRNSFTCIPFAVPFRPLRTTPKPTMHGVQTAVVVGPAGQEIFTDKYGRVKVQFPWDRLGKNDANSSCWIRVATLWAGKQWGWVHIPRIGQEVIVDFLEGDPDRPIITGSVYNAEQMPPYVLPDNMKYSGVKSNSTLGGEGFNEFRFDDTAGAEQIFIHAQKNMDIRVLGSRTMVVGKDKDGNAAGSNIEQIWIDAQRNIKANLIEHIEGNVTTIVGKGEASDGGKVDTTIEKDVQVWIGGDTKVQLGDTSGKLDVQVTGVRSETMKADYNIHGEANINMKSDSDFSLTVGGKLQISPTGDMACCSSGGNVHIQGANVVIEATTALTIKVGGSFVAIGADGVSVVGPMVKLNSGGSAGSGAGSSPTSPVDAVVEAITELLPEIPAEIADALTGYKSGK